MIFRTKAVPTWNQLQITYGFYFTPLPLCWRSKAIPQLQLDSLRRDVPIGSIDVCRDFCRNNHQWIIVALVESRVLARWQPEHIHILQLFPDICSRVVLWKHNQIEREKARTCSFIPIQCRESGKAILLLTFLWHSIRLKYSFIQPISILWVVLSARGCTPLFFVVVSIKK